MARQTGGRFISVSFRANAETERFSASAIFTFADSRIADLFTQYIARCREHVVERQFLQRRQIGAR